MAALGPIQSVEELRSSRCRRRRPMKMPCVSVPVSVLRPARTSLYRWGCTTDSTHL